MGISGSVRCTCYEDGLAAPPPVPVRVDEHDEIRAADPAADAAVREWRRTACRHTDMDLAELHLGWRFVRSFRAGLEEMGAERFPVLLAIIPEWNGAFPVTPAEAATALAELRAFETAAGRITVDRLVAVGSDEALRQTERGEPEWYHRTTPCRAGLTGRGTFAVWPEQDFDTPPTWEATRFTSRVVERYASGAARVVELTSVDTNNTDSVVCDLGLAESERYEVRTLVLGVDDRYLAVPRFRAVLEGAVATGHHAEWG